ncbi:NUDIX hydrolase [Streptomyces sp. NPDC004959]|uniref:NUDIX domain-containing protein n=1 Tax=unclassified Streptomyces TaxID=2593676 RepID=UPI0004C76438|nr:NUDIX hydrolase [Streptomyces sp. NRRL F-5630]
MTIKDNSEQWRTTASETPWRGAKTSVRSEKVVMPDGEVATRDYQVHPGSVVILALDEERRVVVVNQYRHPVRERLWELPAGLLDVPGENPLHAAARELYEEAHLEADEWHVLVDHYSSPGGSDEAVRVFLATGLRDAGEERYTPDGEEADMRTARVPYQDLVRGCLGGELHNSSLVIGALALGALLDGSEDTEAALSGLRPADAPWPARPF